MAFQKNMIWIGRICISLYFLFFALDKIFKPVKELHEYYGKVHIEMDKLNREYKVPDFPIVIQLFGVMEIIASLSLIFKSKTAAHFLLIDRIFFGLFFQGMKYFNVHNPVEGEREEYFQQICFSLAICSCALILSSDKLEVFERDEEAKIREKKIEQQLREFNESIQRKFQNTLVKGKEEVK